MERRGRPDARRLNCEDFAVGDVYKHPYGRTVTETEFGESEVLSRRASDHNCYVEFGITTLYQ